MSQLRNFEISIWTLQDDFITVIESAWIKNKGKTENASMTLNIDGTQQLTFRVPMYYYVDGKRVANPAWLTFTESKVLLNTRKVKVILNKQTDNEEIYEFVIDKVTEEHDRDEFYCDVDCSGLAFYELGKIGYKVALSEEEFYNDDYNWFIGETDSDGNKLFTEQPVANIQYWLNKFLTPYPSSGNGISAATWYYKIQMNWDLTADFAEFTKDSDKIYENDIYGDTYLLSQEKYRMINLEESNFYNLTQNIAETFGVYCKYIYTYDENYHIVGRTIVFYNNFLDEENLAINYRGNTQSISRELDTTDLVTKMFVRTVDNNGDTTSIIDVEENDLGEDYLLNFDYLYSIGSIDEDAYSAIEPYKANLKDLNVQLKAVSERIINIENKLPEVRARASLAEDSIQLDNEKITANNKLLNSLTGGTGILEITNKNPDTAVLLKEQNADYYYIKLTKTGIDASTVKIYKTLSVTSANNTLTSEIKTAIPIYDDSNNLIRMTNIYWNDDTRSKIVYLTYQYQPSLYYENIIKTWIQKLNKDTQEAEDANNELEALESDLDTATKLQRDLLVRKAALNSEFEKLMGPAIREGYWQPDDYSEYAQTFVSNYDIGAESEGTSHYDKFIWDDQLFDEELTISYEEGIDQQIKYYPCIALTNEGQSVIWDEIKNHLNSYSFIFFDTDSSEKRNATTLRTLSFGSGARIIFLERSVKGQNNYGAPAPYLLLPGLEDYLESSINNAKNYSLIGEIEYNNINGYVITGGDDDHGIEINSSWWIDFSTYDYKPVYPRIRIESSSLKTDTNSLIISDNGLYNNPVVLTQYVDYYINNRVEESQYLIIPLDNDTIHPLVTTYYITIKPEIIAKTSQLNNHILKIMFQLSNYGVAIYRDAKEILKDNSKPKVSYTSTIDIFNKNVIKRPSYFLSKIVKINDYELLLDNAWGYISEVTLDLDHPENDNIEIQNYTNKFEDLFTTIVAQTEEMKKTGYLINSLSNSFAPDGTLSATTLRNSLSKVDLNYAFNNGNLTIDEANGIWGTSDTGVVAFRGGGIFTATERDRRNNWIWNTGITPEGINADRITSGQLDTNKIRVFAGDRERFQLNGSGLYGYKSFMSDFDVFYNAGSIDYPSEMRDKIQNDDQVLDPAQFVRFDENGLFLVAKEGAYVLNEDRTEYVIITPQWTDLDGVTHRRLDDDNELKRVAISWDGLTLRNLKGERVFYADSNTGDLKLKGSVFASNFYVIKDDGTTDTFTNYIRINGAEESLLQLRNDLDNNGDIRDRIDTYIDAAENAITEHYDAVTGALQEAIDSANGEIESAKGRITTAEGKISEAEQAIADLDKDLDDSIQLLTDTLTGQQQALTDLTNNYNQFSEDIRDAIVPEVFNGGNLPLDQNYKVGDIFYNTITGDEYICTSVSNPKVAGDWTKTSTPIVHGTKLDVNADAGTIEMLAAGSITLAANSTINMGAGEKINLASNGSINIVTSNQNQEVSTILLKPGDITIASSSTVTMASGAKMNINSGEVKVIGGTIDMSSAGKFNLTGASELNLTGSNVNLTGVSEMNLTGSKLNLTGTSELKLTSSKMDLVSSSELNLSGSKLKLAGTSNLDLVGGSILNIGTTEEASSLNIASKGKLSAIGGDFWIAATDYNTFNGKSDADKKTLSYMHGYLGPLDNKYHLDIGSDNLRIMAGGSLNMESGGTIDIKAGGTIELLSGTDSGIKLSDNGIDILSNAYINIAAGALKISSTGSTTSKSIDTYVSDEIANKTNSLITKVDVEYAQNQSTENPPTSGWSTTAPTWRSGWYIWQRTVTYTSGSTQPSYSDATCISGADGKSGTGITSTTIEYGTSSSASASPASWSEIVPTNIAKGTWLWVKTTILYSDTSKKVSYTKSYVGDDGKDGKSVVIQSVVKEEGKTTVVLNDGTNTSTLTINDGEDGTNGTPGAAGYVHIAWANSADGQTDFSTSESTDKKYIGVYTDNTQADSTSSSAYSWSLIKGADGAGIQSTTITYGTSTSATIEPTSWSNNVPTSIPKKTWLWVKTIITYTGGLSAKTTYTKSYVGDDGKDGKSIYLQSSTKTGDTTTVILVDDDGNTTTLTIKDGEDGANGTPGTNGTNSYVHIAWANSADGTVDFSTSVSANKKYIGVYTDNISTDSITPSSYSWSLIKGEDGVGIDSTSITYGISDSASTQPSTWNTSVPTELDKGDWLWTKTEITYTNGDIKTTYMKSYAGLDGTSGDDGFNQATIYLYQRADNQPANISSGNFTYTFSSGTLSSYPSGWFRNIPTGNNPCWVISSSVISREASITFSYDKWTEPIKLVENGVKTVTIYLYQRNAQQPTVMPGTITYNFSSKTITSGTMNNWQTAVPADNGQPCWIITAIASSVNETDTIVTSEWGTAIKFVESGINQATLYLYQWAQSAPTKPVNSLTYTFSTKTLSGSLGSWSINVPVNNNNYQSCYITSTVVVSSTDTYTISSSEWATPVEFVRNGTDGTSVNILGSYSSEAELRAAHPTGFNGDAYIVNGNLYVWASGDWENVGVIQGPKGDTGDNGTSQYMFIRYATTDLSSTPSSTNFTTTPANDTLYIGICVTTTNSAPSTASGYTWSKYMGTDGINRATIMLYMRSADTPTAKPATFVYDFATGIPSTANLNSWEKSIPADDGNPCWVIAATAISSSAIDQITSDEWTSPTKMVQSGEDGRGIDNVEIRYAVTSATSAAPADSSSDWKSDISQVSPTAGQLLWVRTITTYTDNSTDKTYTKTYMGTNGSSVGISSITNIYDPNNSTKVIGKRVIFTDTKTMDIMNGEDGEDGELVGDNLYLHVAWANQAVYPYEGFSTSISTDKKYLGVYRDNNVADSTNPQLYSWTLIKGEDGIGIKEIKEQYLLYSNTASPSIPNVPPANNWKDEQPIWQENYSIWTCSKITWDDNSITYTEPVKAEGINNINERLVVAELAVNPDSIIATVGEKFVEKDTMIIEDILYYLATDKSTGVSLEDAGWQTTLPTFTNEKPILWIYHDYICEDGHSEKTSPEYIYESDPGSINMNTIIKIVPAEITILSSGQYITYILTDNRKDTIQNLNYTTEGYFNISYLCTRANNTTFYMDITRNYSSSTKRTIKEISSYCRVSSRTYNITEIGKNVSLVISNSDTVRLKATVKTSIENDSGNYSTDVYSSYFTPASGNAVLTNFSSIYWLDNTSSYPSAPTNYITSNSTNVKIWTQKYNPYRDDYNYIYKTDQYKLDDGTYHVGTIDAFNPMIDINSRLQKTELAITDSSIRMRASKIMWESDYSSMTAEGKLTCTGAVINGDLSSHSTAITSMGNYLTDVDIAEGYISFNVGEKYAGQIGGEPIYDSNDNITRGDLVIKSGTESNISIVSGGGTQPTYDNPGIYFDSSTKTIHLYAQYFKVYTNNGIKDL